MTDVAFDRVAPADNQFEAWARALCQFVVRATILPITILFVKPRAFLEKAESGEYRPLPSPFLLAVITGLVLSGITQNLHLLQASEQGEQVFANLFEQVAAYYGELDGVRAFLAAIPYILGLWFLAGLVSAFMFRGIRTAETLMSAVSFSISALVEVTVAMMLVIWLFELNENTALAMAFALGLYALIVAIKLIRLLFVIRKERSSPIVGAVLASLPTLLIIALAGLIAGGLVAVFPSQRDFLREMGHASAMQRGDTHFYDGRYAEAVAEYNRAIEQRETADAYNQLCWTQALWAENLDEALYACNRALELEPRHIAAWDSRGFVHLRVGDNEAAFADYSAAIELNADYAHARYGRGLAMTLIGREAEGQHEMQRALQQDPTLSSQYFEYFSGGRRQPGAATPPDAEAAAPAPSAPEASADP